MSTKRRGPTRFGSLMHGATTIDGRRIGGFWRPPFVCYPLRRGDRWGPGFTVYGWGADVHLWPGWTLVVGWRRPAGWRLYVSRDGTPRGVARPFGRRLGWPRRRWADD